MTKRPTPSGREPSGPEPDGALKNGKGAGIEQPDLFDFLQTMKDEIPPSAHPLDGGLPSSRLEVAGAEPGKDPEANLTPPRDAGTGSDQPGMEASKGLDPLPDPAACEAPAEMPSRILRKRGRPPGGRKPLPAAGPTKAARKPRADNPPAQERAFLSVQSVALRYDASVATIWRWLKTRGFPKPRKIGRLTRWALADLEAFDQAMSNA